MLGGREDGKPSRYGGGNDGGEKEMEMMLVRIGKGIKYRILCAAHALVLHTMRRGGMSVCTGYLLPQSKLRYGVILPPRGR